MKHFSDLFRLEGGTKQFWCSFENGGAKHFKNILRIVLWLIFPSLIFFAENPRVSSVMYFPVHILCACCVGNQTIL